MQQRKRHRVNGEFVEIESRGPPPELWSLACPRSMHFTDGIHVRGGAHRGLETGTQER